MQTKYYSRDFKKLKEFSSQTSSNNIPNNLLD